MKRCLLTCSLLLIMTLGMVPCAQATTLFPATATYQNQFTDVTSSDWFYSHVATLYSLGLTNGKDNPSTFAPESDMTVAEIVTMAARLRSLYEYGAAESGAAQYRTDASVWYAPYVSYLQSGSVITTEFDGRWNETATRAEMAHILANTLPADLFPSLNADSVATGYAARKYITDVTEYTAYQSDILTLYRWGILGGTDETGSFCPDAAIRRSEVAAMMTRLVDSDLRITLAWNTAAPELLSLADLVPSDGVCPVAPSLDDADAVDAALRYMLSRGERTLTLSYDTPTTEDFASSVMHTFLVSMRRYAEQTYNKVSIQYSHRNGKITLTFSSSLYDDSLVESCRDKIFAAAVQTRSTLYADGTITDTMTEYEKAKAYFTWLCDHCTYDDTANANSLSHSAYRVFYEQTAVCDGYTAAYNLLLKLEGISCTAVESDAANHTWTLATLDGVSCHIDPTWGDQANGIAYEYFAMTEAEAFARFH